MLSKKIALVTGCNRGIGKSIAKKFAANGAIVYANARKEDSLDSICNKYHGGGNIIPLYFDVTDRTAVKQAFVTIMKEQGRIDCLVNNAGILVDTLITMLDRKTLKDIYEVNVFAVFEMVSYASRIMSKQKSGSIINVALSAAPAGL